MDCDVIVGCWTSTECVNTDLWEPRLTPTLRQTQMSCFTKTEEMTSATSSRIKVNVLLASLQLLSSLLHVCPNLACSTACQIHDSPREGCSVEVQATEPPSPLSACADCPLRDHATCLHRTRVIPVSHTVSSLQWSRSERQRLVMLAKKEYYLIHMETLIISLLLPILKIWRMY